MERGEAPTGKGRIEAVIFKPLEVVMSERQVSQSYLESKAELLKWSFKARELQATLEATEGVRPSINELILTLYTIEGYGDSFNTYQGWKAAGYQVKKGEKSLKIWGSKRRVDAGQLESEGVGEPDGGGGYSFFPICYIFSDKQVEPIEK